MADTTTDFGDDGFHEIQLSGKQLVFLFMATTVVSVLIFLTGVMVGRNARLERATDAGETAAAATAAPPPAATPVAEPSQAPPSEAPTAAADDALTYRKRLESPGTTPEQLAKPGGSTPASKGDDAPEPASEEPAASAKASTPASAPPAATQPASDGAAAAAPAATATTGRPGRYIVQLVVLRDRNAATSIVRRLTAKGYPAFLTVDSNSSSPLYKVQVGRYDDKREAQSVSRKLEKEEKYKPWVTP